MELLPGRVKQGSSTAFRLSPGKRLLTTDSKREGEKRGVRTEGSKIHMSRKHSKQVRIMDPLLQLLINNIKSPNVFYTYTITLSYLQSGSTAAQCRVHNVTVQSHA